MRGAATELNNMSASAAEERGGLEAAVLGRLRLLRERWMRGPRERGGTDTCAGPLPPARPEDGEEVMTLQMLPVRGALSQGSAVGKALGHPATCLLLHSS